MDQNLKLDKKKLKNDMNSRHPDLLKNYKDITIDIEGFVPSVIVCGRTNVGKSKLLNIVFRSEFVVSFLSDSTTKERNARACLLLQKETKCTKFINIVDTIGFNDTKLTPETIIEDLKFAITESYGGVLAVLFVTDNRITDIDVQIIELIRELVSKEVAIYHVVTKCDQTGMYKKERQELWQQTANEQLKIINSYIKTTFYASIPDKDELIPNDTVDILHTQIATAIVNQVILESKIVENEYIKMYRRVITGELSFSIFWFKFMGLMANTFNVLSKKWLGKESGWIKNTTAWVVEQVKTLRQN